MDDCDVGQALREMRVERGMTQAECADRVGLTPNAWSKIECGARGLSVDYFRPVSDMLGVPYVKILRMFGPVIRHGGDAASDRDDAALEAVLSEYIGADDGVGPIMDQLRRLRRDHNDRKE